MQINIKSLVKRNKSVSCCSYDRIELSPSHTHELCMQVKMSGEDPFFRNNIRCMNYVRSVPALSSDCTFGPKEQVRDI